MSCRAETLFGWSAGMRRRLVCFDTNVHSYSASGKVPGLTDSPGSASLAKQEDAVTKPDER